MKDAAKYTNHTLLAMEGLAIAGAWTDIEKGLIAVIALEMGGSSDLCAHLQPGERIILVKGQPARLQMLTERLAVLVGSWQCGIVFNWRSLARRWHQSFVFCRISKKRQDRSR